MHAFNRGGGRRQPTAANVQCQKCLKRGHYSYECKTQLQERPYKARPSRTQQLLNPKLAPKLTNDVHVEATRKKGVADEELAKKEAERARKRDLDRGEQSTARQSKHRRSRSRSVDSVSSISTRSSRSPPPRRRASPSPRRARGSASPGRRSTRSSRSRSFGSDGGASRRPSLSPEADTDYQQPRSVQRGGHDDYSDSRSRSPTPNDGQSYQRDASPRDPPAQEYPPPPRHRRNSSEAGEESRRGPVRRRDSRSPGRPDPRQRNRAQRSGHGRYRDRDEPYKAEERQRGPPREPEPPRQRSLSPYSKRLALTQAMNMDR